MSAQEGGNAYQPMPWKLTSLPAPSTMMVGPPLCALVVRIAFKSAATAPAEGEGSTGATTAAGAAGAAATAMMGVVTAVAALVTAEVTAAAAVVAAGVAAGVATAAAGVAVCACVPAGRIFEFIGGREGRALVGRAEGDGTLNTFLENVWGLL